MATLTVDPPAAMGALVCYYLFAETWFDLYKVYEEDKSQFAFLRFAILFTVIVEVVAPEVRATAIALFLFFMNQVRLIFLFIVSHFSA